MTTGNNKPLNLQDSFLNKVRSEKKTIVVYLLNGFQVRGRVWGFDNFTVIMESEAAADLQTCHLHHRSLGKRSNSSAEKRE